MDPYCRLAISERLICAVGGCQTMSTFEPRDILKVGVISPWPTVGLQYKYRKSKTNNKAIKYRTMQWNQVWVPTSKLCPKWPGNLSIILVKVKRHVRFFTQCIVCEITRCISECTGHTQKNECLDIYWELSFLFVIKKQSYSRLVQKIVRSAPVYGLTMYNAHAKCTGVWTYNVQCTCKVR